MEVFQVLILMAYVAVCQGNIALYKPTSQSSTTSSYRSSRAVDGKAYTDFNNGSCTHTNRDKRPWWRVDLLQSVSVWLVKITNRADCCWTRLRQLQIRVGNSLSGPDANSLCAYSLNSLGKGETKDFLCSKPITGRYVYITLMVSEILTLCEVEVYASGFTTVSPTSLTGNIARGKPTSQSSNLISCSKNICRGNASRAVDGNTNSIFGADSCTHTKYQKNPWWRVDFKNREVVRKVSLTNRGDCCAERLRQVEVRVGDNGCSYSKNPVCQSFKGEIGSGVTIDLNCNRRGRFLYVRLRTKSFLTLCEVEVFAEKGASLPWTKGKVACTSKKRSSGSYGWIAGPIVAFFFCCCFRGGRRPNQNPQQPQNASQVAADNSNQAPPRQNNDTTQPQNSTTRRYSAPTETTDLPGHDAGNGNGDELHSSKDPPPTQARWITDATIPEAPPPSYEDVIQSSYDNTAFELEPMSVNQASHGSNMSNAPPPPSYSSSRRT